MNFVKQSYVILTCLTLMSTSIAAQATDSLTNTLTTQETPEPKKSTSRELRSKDRFGIHHAPYALGYYVTVRKSTSLSYNTHPNETWEFDWVRAELGFGYWGFDLINFSENYYNFNYRSFANTNSFNWKIGLGYREIDLSLGSESLKYVTSQDIYQNVFNEQAITLNSAVGNRWQWDWGGTLSVDWFEMYVPIFRTSNRNAGQEYADEKTERDVNKAMKFISNIPTATVLKVQMGYSF
jgi:hypothetical protein